MSVVDKKMSVKEFLNFLETEVYDLLRQVGELSKGSKKTVKILNIKKNGFLVLEKYLISDVFYNQDIIQVEYELTSEKRDKKIENGN